MSTKTIYWTGATLGGGRYSYPRDGGNGYINQTPIEIANLLTHAVGRDARLAFPEELRSFDAPPKVGLYGLAANMKTYTFDTTGELTGDQKYPSTGLWMVVGAPLTAGEKDAFLSRMYTGDAGEDHPLRLEGGVSFSSKYPVSRKPQSSDECNGSQWRSLIATILILTVGYWLANEYPQSKNQILVITVGVLLFSIYWFTCGWMKYD